MALSLAVSGDEIRGMAGLHLPTADTTDRSAMFQLATGVAIYGGFDGAKSSPEERDPDENQTILSGDIDDDDFWDFDEAVVVIDKEDEIIEIPGGYVDFYDSNSGTPTIDST
jgi:hypothetical protein